MVLFGSSWSINLKDIRKTTEKKKSNKISYVGVNFDLNMNWLNRKDTISSKLSSMLGFVSRIKKYINIDVCKQLHQAIVQLVLYMNNATQSDQMLVRHILKDYLSYRFLWLIDGHFNKRVLKVFRCLNGFCPNGSCFLEIVLSNVISVILAKLAAIYLLELRSKQWAIRTRMAYITYIKHISKYPAICKNMYTALKF